MSNDASPDLEIAALGGATMGTTWRVQAVMRRGRDLHGLHAGIQAALDEVVAQMSTWEADSDISRYNDAASGSDIVLPGGFGHVMEIALEVAAASGGAFDPTVGPMVALWGFGAARGPLRIPADGALATTRARVGWQRLQWDARARKLLQPGGVALDLSGIAKGHGVDVVVAYLRHAGVAAGLVEVGGELHGYGTKPDGQPWRVLVESAPEEDAASSLPARVLALRDQAVATSGDRWHHFEVGDQRYSHTFDPRLGRPVPAAPAAVTVVAGDAARADAWATAMTVLGPGEGLRLAERLSLSVRFLQREAGVWREHMSPAFETLLEAAA